MRVYIVLPAMVAAILFLATGVQSAARIENTHQHKNATIEGWVIPDETMRKFPMALLGYDNEHRRVYLIEYGKWDLRSAVEAKGKTLENLQRHIDKMVYRIINDGPLYAGLDDSNSDEIILIADWDGFSVFQMASGPTVTFFLKNMATFQRLQHWLHRGFFINVNAVAETFLNLARPLMGSFMERMDVYGPQKSRWAPKLLRVIPKEELPLAYGGVKSHKPLAVYG